MAGSEPLSQTLKGIVDDQNISFLDAVRSAGYTKYRVDLSSMFVKKGTYFTFLKLCIEQGSILEKKPDSIWVMGDKATARETMKKVGVPTVPGSDGLLQSMEEAIKLAHEIGFPVMKAAHVGFCRALLAKPDARKLIAATVALLIASTSNLLIFAGRSFSWRTLWNFSERKQALKKISNGTYVGGFCSDSLKLHDQSALIISFDVLMNNTFFGSGLIEIQHNP